MSNDITTGFAARLTQITAGNEHQLHRMLSAVNVVHAASLLVDLIIEMVEHGAIWSKQGSKVREAQGESLRCGLVVVG